jgi:MoaA/NifB/PqqE/SkfB family radical SAM enzyme
VIVVWRVTSQCNLGCSFCAFDRAVAQPRLDMNAQSILRLGDILADYSHDSQRRVLLSFLGGEPFLWPPLTSVSRALSGKGKLQLSATTNGTTLHSESARRLVLDTFAQLTVSVDGFAAVHDALRDWPGGWTRLKNNVMALNEARRRSASPLMLRANIVVMHDNVDQFAALCEELADWGFDEITFNQLGGRDRPEFSIEHRLRAQDVERLRNVLVSVRSELAKRKVKLCGGEAYLNRIAASARGNALSAERCAPDEPFVFIDEQGWLAPCHFTVSEYGVHVDGIQSPADLLSVLDSWARAKRARPTNHCKDCHSTQAFAKFA